MRPRKQRFFTKSDLIFGLVLAVAFAFHACYLKGMRKHYVRMRTYKLSCHLREQIRVAGVVRTPGLHLPIEGFDYTAGGMRRKVSPFGLRYDEQLGGYCYELLIPAGWADADTDAGKWREQFEGDFGAIVLKVRTRPGWCATPRLRIIRGPTLTADFEVTKEP